MATGRLADPQTGRIATCGAACAKADVLLAPTHQTLRKNCANGTWSSVPVDPIVVILSQRYPSGRSVIALANLGAAEPAPDFVRACC